MDSSVLVAPSPGQVELRRSTVPDPTLNEIQIDFHVSIISAGSERAHIKNLPNTFVTFPMEPGYCASGVVTKVGDGVSGFAANDRVCCYSNGHRSMGNIDTKWVVPIPDGVTFEEAAFMPLGQTSLQGIRKVRIELGESSLVLGMGLVGQLAAQLIKLDGAVPVIGVDRVPDRLQSALECGIDEVIEARDEDWISTLAGKPQVVIESTGSPEAVSDAFKIVSPFGRVSLLGCPRGESLVDFYSDVHLKGVTVVGAHAIKPVPEYESRPGFWTWMHDAVCFMELLRRGRVILGPLVTERVSCREIEDVFRELLEGKLDKLGIVIDWK